MVYENVIRPCLQAGHRAPQICNETYVGELAYINITAHHPDMFKLQDLDDLLQECYILAWENFENMVSNGYSVTVMASHIERVLIIRYERRRKAHAINRQAEEFVAARRDAVNRHNCDDFEELMFMYLDGKMLMKDILPHLQRHEMRTLAYQFVDGLTFKHIGKLLDVSQNHARSNSFYALEKLRHPGVAKRFNFSVGRKIK